MDAAVRKAKGRSQDSNLQLGGEVQLTIEQPQVVDKASSSSVAPLPMPSIPQAYLSAYQGNLAHPSLPGDYPTGPAQSVSATPSYNSVLMQSLISAVMVRSDSLSQQVELLQKQYVVLDQARLAAISTLASTILKVEHADNNAKAAVQAKEEVTRELNVTQAKLKKYFSDNRELRAKHLTEKISRESSQSQVVALEKQCAQAQKKVGELEQQTRRDQNTIATLSKKLEEQSKRSEALQAQRDQQADKLRDASTQTEPRCAHSTWHECSAALDLMRSSYRAQQEKLEALRLENAQLARLAGSAAGSGSRAAQQSALFVGQPARCQPPTQQLPSPAVELNQSPAKLTG